MGNLLYFRMPFPYIESTTQHGPFIRQEYIQSKTESHINDAYKLQESNTMELRP
jgi:hypothetical protein